MFLLVIVVVLTSEGMGMQSFFNFKAELERTKTGLQQNQIKLEIQVESYATKLVQAKQELHHNLTELESKMAKLESKLGSLLEPDKTRETEVTLSKEVSIEEPKNLQLQWWQSEHLPLLPWEIESITGECNPPEGIPKTCCARATTKGSGQPVEFSPHLCTTEIERYQNVAAKAIEFLKQHPIPTTTGLTSKRNDVATIGCDVCRIIQIMQQQNWTTLAMMGDSMTRQTFEGFKCELFRRGYQIDVNLERPFKDPHAKGFRYGVREKSTLTLTTKKTSITAAAKLKIIFYIMYQPTVESLQQHILGQQQEGGADVLVFDHSLWYRHWEIDKFVKEMTDLLQGVSSSSRPPKMLFWREQSAQHFNTPGGQFSPSSPPTVPNATTTCVPIHQYTENYKHVDAMKNVTRNLGIDFVVSTDKRPTTSNDDATRNLYFIPFRDFSSQFHDIHRKGECTHYCSTPDLWLPISRVLRLHMDNFVQGSVRTMV